ncbi:exodeoxyribonuclease VII small subunit [Helicobacter saguini]|nr:exodeoxyribonuclease VII small subunit [Helicobacter saguini]
MENKDMQNMDFEAHLEKVKQIVDALNKENINLKDGLKLYKEAQNHLSIANSMLESAEFELKELINQN